MTMTNFGLHSLLKKGTQYNISLAFLASTNDASHDTDGSHCHLLRSRDSPHITWPALPKHERHLYTVQDQYQAIPPKSFELL